MASIGPTTTDHPVVHDGLYGTLQQVALECTRGSIAGSTTNAMLTTVVDSTVGCALDCTLGSYEE
eukprot:5678528-Lingulodinium_polyedra.AAC.1